MAKALRTNVNYEGYRVFLCPLTTYVMTPIEWDYHETIQLIRELTGEEYPIQVEGIWI